MSKNYAKQKVANKEREIKRHEKEVRTTQQTIITTNANIMKIQKQVEGRKRTIFNSACSHANVREMGDRLHRQNVVDVLTQVLLSNNLNFGNTTPKLKDVKAKAKT
jgi:hypothetical protein